MTAPERIWAEMPEIFDGMGFWQENKSADLVEYIRAGLAAVPAQVNEEQNTEQRKRFWNWLPLAYRDGHIGEHAKFTKYNMEVAHYAGWSHAIEPQPYPRDEVIARLVEALEEGRRAIGEHCAPHDCYATGPLTGDAFRDLVQCPACSFIERHDAAIAAAKAVQHA